MVKVELLIANKKGMHARPAAKLVRLAAGFPDAQIHVTSVIRRDVVEEVCVIATSVLGLLMLAADKGCKLVFEADGAQAAEALAAIAALVEAKFEEVE
jgi:phosphocarrier protein